jgi:hypothetical protein
MTFENSRHFQTIQDCVQTLQSEIKLFRIMLIQVQQPLQSPRHRNQTHP